MSEKPPHCHGSVGSIADSEIAIISMSCRVPGANDVDTFWQNLRDGKESISFFSEAELKFSGVDPVLLKNPRYVKAGGVLTDIELFDAALFGYSPREAELIDPQQRLFLECAFEALERAGHASENRHTSIGVFAGVGRNENSYFINNLHPNRELMESVDRYHLLLSNDKDYLTTRVSYKLDLIGPSVAVQTACSTSLVAIHLACQSLLSGECDIALAGGVTVNVPQKLGYLYQEGMIFSPDGHCRPFDARAHGTVTGNGVGVVVLRLLKDAIAHGDCIQAVIKGSAVNNDGSSKVGYTAPSVDGQAAVISEAMATGEVDPETVSYVETHGTGTALGDPIEIAALSKAFRSATNRTCYCAIGSVKSNIGHLDAASGVVGLIKTVLMLNNKLLPPTLNFINPNPDIDFDKTPFYVNSALSEWKSDGTLRRAGVSSFGIGGTNAHVVLEEARPRGFSGKSRPCHLLVFSAQTIASLEAATTNMARHLERNPGINLADVAYTLQVGRRALKHRRMLVCRESGAAAMALHSPDAGQVVTGIQQFGKRPVAFLFPGQGAQYISMAHNLYENESYFCEQVDECSNILLQHLGLDLRRVMYPTEQNAESATQQLSQTAITQPALFVTEYALAKLWMKWGVHPQGMIGHSIGEYVAACLAGVFSLEDVLSLVASRGRLVQELPVGAMLAISLGEQDVRAFLGSQRSLAAVNSLSQCVVSGTTIAIEELQQQLAERGVECRRLQTSHAFHSDMLIAIEGRFLEEVKKVRLKSPLIPFVSSVTGDWITSAQATDARYWAFHLHQPVRFASGVQHLLKDRSQILIEVGPGRTLTSLVKRHPDKTDGHIALSSLPHPQDRQTDVEYLLRTLGRLWLTGMPVDWLAFHDAEERHYVPLPTYPFDRKRYWVDATHSVTASPSIATPLTPKSRPLAKRDMTDCVYIPSWKRAPLPAREPVGAAVYSRCLLFVDECGVSDQLLKQLELQGLEVFSVRIASDFARPSDRVFTINPAQRDHYDSLFGWLRAHEKLPNIIIHLWSVTAPNSIHSLIATLDRAQDLGLQSLLFVAQAIGKQHSDDACHILVVSNQMQDVTGGELACPEKATLLGLVRVVPQEYPNMHFRSVDIVIPPEGSTHDHALTNQLLAELTAPSSELVVALRGVHRWVQTIEPLRLEEMTHAPSKLRQGGVYLITGGLGGIGLVLALRLARSVRAKLILTAPAGFPARDAWNEWLSSEDDTLEDNTRQSFLAASTQEEARIASEIDDEISYIMRRQCEVAMDLDIQGLHSYEGFERVTNELCASYIYDFFRVSRINTDKGRWYRMQELRDQLKLLPKFARFFVFFVRVLSEDGFVDIHEDRIEFLRDPDAVKHPAVLRRQAEDLYPQFKGLFSFLDHCVSQYREALSGELPAISVLYPIGRPDVVNESSENTIAHGSHTLYRIVLRELLQRLAEKSHGATLRVLEIGAGRGLLTKVIAPGLANCNVQYCFTDIGRSFVINAEREFGEFSFMTFRVLDISQDGKKQGFEDRSFDLIIGEDVVHATKRIEDTLTCLKRLLAPNGVMGLIEEVSSKRWTDMTWGLAEGRWQFDDESIRKDSPLLSLEKWGEVLEKQEFKGVHILPRMPSMQATTDCALIIAQQKSGGMECGHLQQQRVASGDDRRRIRAEIEALRSLEQAGAEVLVFAGDVADRQRMLEVVTRTEKRFGCINGVIHCSYVSDGEARQLRMRDSTEHMLLPKVRSALVLDEVFKHSQVDFVVHCSSLGPVGGGLGFLGHYATNAFLDAFADRSTLAQSGSFTLSINWHELDEIGLPLGGMTPEECAELFERSLGAQLPQILVSPRESHVQGRGSDAISVRDQVIASERMDVATSGYPRPELGHEYAAPRNDAEQTLAVIWQEVLGIRQVGVHDSFFDLGGESLLATQLIARINHAFSVDLSLRRVIETPTVAGLARALACADSRRARLFCLSEAPVLASRLDDLPIYSLGFYYDDLRAYSSIQEIATVNIERLRALQREGPYQLSGFGGMALVAFEMARRLHEQGEEVSLLALIDPPAISPIHRARLSRPRYFSGLLLYLLSHLAKVRRKLWLRYSPTRTPAIRAAISERSMEVANGSVELDVLSRMENAIMAYKPKLYAGRVTLVVSSDRVVESAGEAHFGWSTVASGGLEVRIVPGDHSTIFHDRSIQILAKELKDLLARTGFRAAKDF